MFGKYVAEAHDSRMSSESNSTDRTAFTHVGYQKFFEVEISRRAKPQAAVPAQCSEPLPPTEPNIPGPYYRPDAPWRENLADGEELGRKIRLRGAVVDRCKKPIKAAILDVWQATADGHYDNDGSPEMDPTVFRLRGRLKVNARGEYEFRTIWPGAYSIGGGVWRPPHLHVKVSASGYDELITQLYFHGDPLNEGDFAYHESLEIDPRECDGRFEAIYNFVLLEERHH